MQEEMKSSKVKFIGMIPNLWHTKRVKFVIEGIKDGTHGTFERVDFGKSLLSAKNVFDDGLHIGNMESEISDNDYLSIISNGYPQKNDVLLCCVGTIGRCCVYNLEEPIAFQRSVAFLRPNNKTSSVYLKYCLQSDSTIKQEQLLINKSAQDGLYMGAIRELIIPFNDKYSEQQAIADFLDKQCARIDSITADIEIQIELLHKYKKALITETITKGLDKTVLMKDSGIEWIGGIAKNFVLRRLKYMTTIKDGTHDTPDYVIESNSTYPLITSKYINYETKKICFEDAKHISKEDFRAIYRRSNVEIGDIIMPMIGTIGKPVIVYTDKKFAIKNVALFKTGHDIITAKYIFYQFYSYVLLNQFILMARGGVQSFVSLEVLGNLLFIDADYESKKRIVEILDEQCLKINSIIKTKKLQLKTIQQYKKSLIYEYITGKKRVLGVQN